VQSDAGGPLHLENACHLYRGRLDEAAALTRGVGRPVARPETNRPGRRPEDWGDLCPTSVRGGYATGATSGGTRASLTVAMER
jgi:hypothetical protein